jgi:hypothetical protein
MCEMVIAATARLDPLRPVERFLHSRSPKARCPPSEASERRCCGLPVRSPSRRRRWKSQPSCRRQPSKRRVNARMSLFIFQSGRIEGAPGTSAVAATSRIELQLMQPECADGASNLPRQLPGELQTGRRSRLRTRWTPIPQSHGLEHREIQERTSCRRVLGKSVTLREVSAIEAWRFRVDGRPDRDKMQPETGGQTPCRAVAARTCRWCCCRRAGWNPNRIHLGGTKASEA